MLPREIKDITLTFDNEKEALEKYEEILRDNNIVERKIYKDFSETFQRWVYKISYRKDTVNLCATKIL